MRTTSTVAAKAAFVLTALFALLGVVFALGYAFDDPGGLGAVLIAASVIVPLSVLTFVAVRMPDLAPRVLAVGVVAYAVWAVLEELARLVDAPVVPMVALVLAVPTAVVGLRRPERAAPLMLATAMVPVVALVVRLVAHPDPEGAGPGLAHLLGGSTGVVVMPLLFVAGLLFLAARAASPVGRHA